MWLVEVIPFTRSLPHPTLSYYTKEVPREGDIISVTVRGAQIPALVSRIEPMSSARTDVRRAGFALRKLSARSASRVLSPVFATVAARVAEYHASPLGVTCAALAPLLLLRKPKKLEVASESVPFSGDIKTEKLIFQASYAERVSRYRSLIREAFARGESIFILVPTRVEGERLARELSRGIESFVFTLHSDLALTKLRKAWNGVVSSAHQIVVVATGTYLSLPRADFGTIVVERESAQAYKLPARPFLDMRAVAECHAEAQRSRLIFADSVLRAETFGRFLNRELEELAPPRARMTDAPSIVAVDMRKEPKSSVGVRARVDIETISALAQERIKATREDGRRTFVFCARRGMAPLTVCGDCGSPVRCLSCDANVVLHKGGERNVFVCHSCGATRNAHETCRTCGSWKLKTLGVGIEKVRDRLAELFPDALLLQLDAESARTHAQAMHIMEAFSKTKGAILVGTERALPYLTDDIALAIVASADSLLLLPEWRSHERLFSILIRLAETTREHLIIQTRHPDESLLAFAVAGEISAFVKDELARREEYRYPPYSILIRVSALGTRSGVATLMEEIEERLAPWEPLRYSPAVHLGKGRYSMHALIRLTRERWPENALRAALLSLPRNTQTIVAPENLL